MPTAQDRVDSYAALVVRVGVNVQPGQQVVLLCDIAHAPIARAITEQAYVAGAAKVRVEYADMHVRRSGLRHATAEALTSVDPWELDRLDHFTEQGIAFIRLTGNPEPHLLDDIPPERTALSSP